MAMARQVRIEYPGAIYHAMARGDRREDIVLDDTDRGRFAETLGEVVESSGWLLYAWVLMGNHYHLVFETPEANLVDARGVSQWKLTDCIREAGRGGSGRSLDDADGVRGGGGASLNRPPQSSPLSSTGLRLPSLGIVTS